MKKLINIQFIFLISLCFPAIVFSQKQNDLDSVEIKGIVYDEDKITFYGPIARIRLLDSTINAMIVGEDGLFSLRISKEIYHKYEFCLTLESTGFEHYEVNVSSGQFDLSRDLYIDLKPRVFKRRNFIKRIFSKPIIYY